MRKKTKILLSIFGATGVIGNLTFEIIDLVKDKNFIFFLFTANKNVKKMISLILKYSPQYVYMFDENLNYVLEQKLKSIINKNKNKIVYQADYIGNAGNSKNIVNEKKEIKTVVLKNRKQLINLFQSEIDRKQIYEIKNDNGIKEENYKNNYKYINHEHIFINGIMGYNGIIPTLISQKKGIKLGLANKESIVILGEKFKSIKNIYPLDSEHFALYKLLKSIKKNQIRYIIITSSGGKVHNIDSEAVKRLNLEDILQHPTWSMGDRITIDSSTGMNKAFEVLEAHYLFNIPLSKIKVYINKTSNIHGIILTKDNTYYVQASVPDMHLSIYNFFKDVVKSDPDFNFEYTDFNAIDFTLENVQFSKFKVLEYLYKNYKNVTNIGPKYIILNDLLLEKLINKEIKFYQYNEIFFKIFNKIKSYNFDFSMDENLIIFNLEKLKKVVESYFIDL